LIIVCAYSPSSKESIERAQDHELDRRAGGDRAAWHGADGSCRRYDQDRHRRPDDRPLRQQRGDVERLAECIRQDNRWRALSDLLGLLRESGCLQMRDMALHDGLPFRRYALLPAGQKLIELLRKGSHVSVSSDLLFVVRAFSA